MTFGNARKRTSVPVRRGSGPLIADVSCVLRLPDHQVTTEIGVGGRPPSGEDPHDWNDRGSGHNRTSADGSGEQENRAIRVPQLRDSGRDSGHERAVQRRR